MPEHVMHLIIAAGTAAGVIALQQGIKAICRRFLRRQCTVVF